MTKILDTKNKSNIYFQDNKIEFAKDIYEILEKPNRAPFLASSINTIQKRIEVFPEGQLLLKNNNNYIASLSTNQIQLENLENLPTRDTVAGEQATYENTYIPNGNTICLMSMNIHKNYQGQGISKIMIKQAQKLAKNLNIENLIGSFRPNEYGIYKENNKNITFEKYIKLVNKEGWPIDLRLRSLKKNGMEYISIDKKAMEITIDINEFHFVKKNHNIHQRREISSNIRECGEVGVRITKGDKATYIESNLRGKLPIE